MGEQPRPTESSPLADPPAAAGADIVARRSAHSATWIAIGALCGVTWATGFRAYMSEIAGPASAFDWIGTFAAIILPGLVAGALLGWAAHSIARNGARGILWGRLAPLAFAIAPLLMPGALQALLTQGLGGGAVAVALIAIGGGFSLGRIGPLWARIVVGVLSLALAAGIVATVPLIGGRALQLTEPRGAWAALLAACFLAVLMLASSIPWRRARR